MKGLCFFGFVFFSFAFFFNAKGSQNPYVELQAIKTDYIGFKAYVILQLDLALHAPAKVLKNIEYIKHLATEKKDLSLNCLYYETLANFYSLKEHRINSSATENYQKAIQFAEKNELPSQVFRQYFNFGNYFFTYGQYASAYKYFKEALLILGKIGEKNVAQVWTHYLILGKYFYEIKDYPFARKMLYQALLYKDNMSNRERFNAINTLGLISLNCDKDDDAINYFNQVLKQSDEVLDTAWMGIAYGNMGSVCVKNKEWDQAILYFKLDYEYNSKPYGDKLAGYQALKKLAELQYQRRDFKKALENIDIYLTNVDRKTKNYQNLVEAYDLKVRLMDTLSIREGQLEALKEASKYSRLLSTFNNNLGLELLRLEEEKIKFDETYIEFKEYKMLNVILIGSILILVLITSFVIFIYRKRGVKRALSEIEKKDDIKVCALEIMCDKRYHNEEAHRHIEISVELRQLLELNLLNNRNWEKFKLQYLQRFPNFFSDMLYSFPELTEADLRLLALTNLNFSNKELADKLSVSVDGVKKAKMRLKKKLHDHVS